MNYILLVRTFLEACKAMEQLMPESKGKEKFDAAITMIEQIFGSVETMLPALSMLATLAVSTYRTLGVFRAK
jgi:hypothetical protein